MVSVQKGTKEIRKLYKGDSFGEQALYYNTARTMTCKSVEDNVFIYFFLRKWTNGIIDNLSCSWKRNNDENFRWWYPSDYDEKHTALGYPEECPLFTTNQNPNRKIIGQH